MKRSDDSQRARERLEARRGFFAHLAVFVVVNTALVIINMTTAPDDLWAKWPLMGWSIGLAFHGFAVFVIGDRFAITDEMVERELSKGTSQLTDGGSRGSADPLGGDGDPQEPAGTSVRAL